jgi:hypothetical protein
MRSKNACLRNPNTKPRKIIYTKLLTPSVQNNLAICCYLMDGVLETGLRLIYLPYLHSLIP